MRFTRHLLCLALLTPAAQANELMRVYDLAAQNDPVLDAAAHQRDAGRQARPLARSALLPQITGTVGYSKSKSDGTESTAFPGTPPSGPTPVSRDSTDDAATITLNQSLFDWAAIQRLRQASDQVALAETGYRAAEQGLALRVAEAYFGVLTAADNLRTSIAENNAIERQLEQAKKRFEVGLSAITDVQEAQARFDLTVSNLIDAEQALSSAKEALTTITGPLTALHIPGVQEDLPLPAPDPANVDAWVSAARDNNLELLSSRLTADLAKKGVNIASAGHIPTLGAQAQYQDSTSDGSRFSGDTKSKTIGVQLNIPIYSGGATRANVRSAVATHEQRLAEYEGKKRQVDKQTRDAYQGVLSGAARVKALKTAVLSNTTALEASETGLQVGARTAVDVLNTQQQLYGAQRNYSKSRYDYLLSVLRLKAAAGRLGAQDIAEIDRLLIQ